ncbi:hypothetical protein NX02_25700 [Sphingomonas sanxanigenens DSM 19645 = NX02]|uniref:Uncharacterized protein n=2 Tax=Sphingomonas sanxanigenens TaxID=397260 RepID=W0AM16_9SPHN|nr:hypothetical protein NX02_25700 [Sphingomonas sanxanigenens DSM 19645 = NX02]
MGGAGVGSQVDSQSTGIGSTSATSPNAPSTMEALAASPTTMEAFAATPTALEALAAQPSIEVAEVAPAPAAQSFVCDMPTLSIGFGASAYSGIGGGANFGVSYDPPTGTLSFDVGMEVGVGIGAAARVDHGIQHSATRSATDPGVSAGIGLSVNGQANTVSGRVEHEMVGSNMHAPAEDRTKVSVGGAGIGASINANIYAGGSVAGQVYDPGCAPPSS